VGFYGGGLLSLKNGAVEAYDSSHGLAQGTVQAIYEDRTGAVWVGTSDGLSRFQNRAWTTWTARQGLPGGVQGILEDHRESLWLLTDKGLLRARLKDLQQAAGGASGSLTFTQYGRSEGLRLASASVMPGPRMARSAAGHVWVATDDGVAIVDPERAHGNPIPPPVMIEQVLVDGKPADPNSPDPSVFRAHQLQFTYTGLSLSAPEGVRFRYKLDGVEKTWQDAGTRRNVVYVNLPPGGYQFHVIACNNDGVWNNAGAAFAFRLEPYFYQTLWFAGLCAALVALTVWGIHKLYVRRLVARFQLVAQERARMTRELHDSLLQGFSGVVYQLDAAARQFQSNPELSKQRLDRAIDQADQSLSEARRALTAMRIPALENATLPEALSTTGAKLTDGSGTAFHLTAKGHIRPLSYDAQAALYLIGREAITNAVNHAQAGRIQTQLVYSDKEIRLTIQDDGVGFDPAIAAEKKDHWGVIGMRERANQIGASFTLDSALGRGTKMVLTLDRRKTPDKARQLFSTFTR
jgi:two-component sensor histidine kinase